MTGLLFAALAALAAGVWIWRGLAARTERRRARAGPGMSLEQAIPVRSFDDIDLVIAGRRCHCGKSLRLTGEGARQEGELRLRASRLVCDECEETFTIYFDLTEVCHWDRQSGMPMSRRSCVQSRSSSSMDGRARRTSPTCVRSQSCSARSSTTGAESAQECAPRIVLAWSPSWC